MDHIGTHDNGGLQVVGQEGYRARIWDHVDPAELDVDPKTQASEFYPLSYRWMNSLQANVRVVLGFGTEALAALETLSSHSSLDISETEGKTSTGVVTAKLLNGNSLFHCGVNISARLGKDHNDQLREGVLDFLVLHTHVADSL